MTLAREAEDVVAVPPTRPDASTVLKARTIPGEPLVFCQHCMAEETGVLISGRDGSNKTDTPTRRQAGEQAGRWASARLCFFPPGTC